MDILNTKPLTLEDWQNICQQNLAIQKQFTINPFIHADTGTPHLNEIYLPSAVKEEGKLSPIAEECFFEDVLRRGKNQINQGRKIAIIGEPGSGKTVRLQKIADWILEQELGLPIWISLRDLTQPTITQYIEEVWLKQADKSLSIDDLIQHKARIWLLLDGWDEMTLKGEKHHASLLLGELVQAARVVVTCRTNVWEVDKNTFSGFNVFHNLNYNPEQVMSYIRRWFAAMGDTATGESLEAELTQSENYWFKQLFENPLRLWMLCQIWQTGDGLPQTQAHLYGQFIKWVYRLKADEEILDQREALDKALARLALAAMERKDRVSPLRLPESWVLQILGGRPIFQTVMKLGLLNRGEHFPEPICVFYHATFQEYFAALAVDEWDYFLPPNHINLPVKRKKYRIFELRWKQVILFWFGRGDIASEEKERFLEKLINFDDGCGEWKLEQVAQGFYEYCAYLLAAAAINEFKTCSLASEIVKQVVKWGFGSFNVENSEWQTCLEPIEEEARKAIPITIRLLAITELTTIVEICPDEEACWQVAESLGEIDPSNPQVIAVLIRILETTDDEDTCEKAVQSLGKIGQGNPKAITALTTLLERTEEDDEIYGQVAESLEKTDPGNSQAIAALIGLLITDDERTRWQAEDRLKKINSGISQAITALIETLETTDDEDTRWRAVESLREIGEGSPEAITALIRLLEMTDEDDDILWLAADCLGNIGEGSIEAIFALIRLLETTEYDDIYDKAYAGLVRIGKGHPQAIAELIDILENCEYSDYQENCWRVARCLGEIGEGNPEVIAALTAALETTDDEGIRREAAESLQEIGEGNPEAITDLVRILETADDKDIRSEAAFCLGAIGEGNPEAIADLVRIIETTDDEDTSWLATSNLGRIGKGNPEEISALIRVLETSDYKYTRESAAESLGKIGKGNPEAVTALINVLETSDDESSRRVAAESLGKIEKGNSEAITALIKVLETIDDEETGWKAAESLGQIGEGSPEEISALIRVLETSDHKYTRERAADSLAQIGKSNPEATTALIKVLETADDEDISRQAVKRLGKIGQDNPQVIAALIRILETSGNRYTRSEAIENLGKIGQGNSQVIATLIRILETTDDDDTRSKVADSLAEIDPGNPDGISMFIQILETTSYRSSRYSQAVESLKKIESGNFQAISGFIKVLKTADNESAYWWALCSLRRILTTPKQYSDVVSALKDCLSDEVYQSNFDRFHHCYKVVWDCTSNLSYPDFYRAWHSLTEN